MEFAGQDFSSLSHYHLSHWAEEAVAIHAIDQFLIPKTVPPARAVEVIRQARHRFRAAGKHAFQVAVCDFLKSQRDCFESGGACLVHRVRRYSFGNAAADGDLERARLSWANVSPYRASVSRAAPRGTTRNEPGIRCRVCVPTSRAPARGGTCEVV